MQQNLAERHRISKNISEPKITHISSIISFLREVLLISWGHIPENTCPELPQPSQKVSQCLALHPQSTDIVHILASSSCLILPLPFAAAWQ